VIHQRERDRKYIQALVPSLSRKGEINVLDQCEIKSLEWTSLHPHFQMFVIRERLPIGLEFRLVLAIA
jgi:hypothetical protein